MAKGRSAITGKKRAAPRLAPEALRAEVRRTHGLTLPDHLFDFAARWVALSRAERDVLKEAIGFSPAGVLAELAARPPPRDDDAPPNLRFRHDLDPPEFLLVAIANGGRIGLFYDDDRLAPAFVMRYTPVDEATLVYAGASLHEALRRAMNDALSMSAEEAGVQTAEFPASPGLLRGSEIAASIPLPRPSIGAPPPFEDPMRVATSSGARLWVPGKKLGRRYAETDPAAARKLLRAPPEMWQPWVDKARADCASGEPVEALALGHDLHHLAGARSASRFQAGGAKERAAAATDLLVAAYRALGREALARIAEAQQARRHAT